MTTTADMAAVIRRERSFIVKDCQSAKTTKKVEVFEISSSLIKVSLGNKWSENPSWYPYQCSFGAASDSHIGEIYPLQKLDHIEIGKRTLATQARSVKRVFWSPPALSSIWSSEPMSRTRTLREAASPTRRYWRIVIGNTYAASCNLTVYE